MVDLCARMDHQFQSQAHNMKLKLSQATCHSTCLRKLRARTSWQLYLVLGGCMDDPVTIRVAEVADVSAVLRIYSQPALDAGEVLSSEAAAALLERFSSYPNYSLYVACVDGEVVGTFALLVMDNLGHLGRRSAIVEDVAVEPRYQGRGIGGQMMRFAMRKPPSLTATN